MDCVHNFLRLSAFFDGELSPPPWWKRLLRKVFPCLRHKIEFRTTTTERYDRPGADHDVYSEKPVQRILEEDRITQEALRDSSYSGLHTTWKGKN